MSFSGHAILSLHVAAVIFGIGPGTAAIMSTPRQIRRGNINVVRYLLRTTLVYSAVTILVLVFGLILAGLDHDFAKWWVSVSITLFVVACVLLVLIMRDQRKAITALESLTGPAPSTSLAPGAPAGPAVPAAAGGTDPGDVPATGGAAGGEGEAGEEGASRSAKNEAARIAAVERGRIASLSGIVGLIWLATLVLMVWK